MKSHELAARMQLAIPEVADLNRETAAKAGLGKNEQGFRPHC